MTATDRPAIARAGDQAIGGLYVNSEFWMPAPANGTFERMPSTVELLTEDERTVLRRLKRGPRPSRRYRPLSVRRQRAALRQRRVLLDGLGRRDLRSLVQIIMQLGL